MGYVVLITLLTLITGGLCIPNTYFYFTDYSYSRVYRIDPAQPQRYSVPVLGLQNPTAVGYDEQNVDLYVFNGHLSRYNTTKYILKYQLNSGSTRRLELLRSAIVSTVAIDSGSGLLYYADVTENVIAAVTTDFRYQTVIIDNGLEAPSDIALDIVNKAIYWCDVDKSFPYIGKANMDGTSRRNIVFNGLYQPYGIALDTLENKIYWVDHTLNKMERCNTDGTGRETVLSLAQGSPILVSVAVDETYVYWLQLRRGAILKKRKSGVQIIETIGTELAINSTNYRSLRLGRTSPPPQGANACSRGGGCQHICIPTSQSRVCRCTEGHILQADGSSCQKASFTRGLVVVDITTRVLIVLDLDKNITRKLTDTWYSEPRGIALDEKTFEIYWSDRARRAIYKTCIPTPCFQVIKVYKQGSYLGDLALDTQRKYIYVGDSGLDKITKISYSGNQEQIISQGGFKTETDVVIQIALDLNARKIYWALSNTIQVANMDDGSDRRQLQAGLNIGGLVLDTQTQKLYVLRFDTNDLEVMDLTRGPSLQRVYEESGTAHFAGLALGDGMLYFGNRNEGSTYEFNIATREVKKYGQNKVRRSFSIAYFNMRPVTPATTQEPVPGATHETVSGATPEGMLSTGSSSGDLLNRTLIISVSVILGGLIIIVGIVICGVVIYKRTLTSVTPSTTPHAVNLPLGHVPPPKPKQVPVTDSGEYSEIREFPTIPQIRPPLPLPKKRPPNQITRARDPTYLNPIAPPSNPIHAQKYESLQVPLN